MLEARQGPPSEDPMPPSKDPPNKRQQTGPPGPDVDPNNDNCQTAQDCKTPCAEGTAMACENSKCVCKENTPQVNWEQIIEDLGNMPSNKLCTGTKSSYTTDNWRALEMDKWLLAQTDVLGSQPLPADLGDGEGLPGLWAKYNAKMEKDDLFFWPSTCKQ